MLQQELLQIYDLFMSEYGWTFNTTKIFIETNPWDVVVSFANKIQERKLKDMRIQAFFIGAAAGAVFSGEKGALAKILDDVQAEDSGNLSEDMSEAAAKGSLKTMWVSMGRNPEDFEAAFAKGKIEF